MLKTGLHPHLVSLHCPAACQTSNTLFPAAATFIWQKGLLPLSRPRDLHCSLPMPSSSPYPPQACHTLFLMPWVLTTHTRALLCNVRLSKPCLIHLYKESSHKPQILQQRNVQQTRQGVQQIRWTESESFPHVHHQSITTNCMLPKPPTLLPAPN